MVEDESAADTEFIAGFMKSVLYFLGVLGGSFLLIGVLVATLVPPSWEYWILGTFFCLIIGGFMFSIFIFLLMSSRKNDK